MLDSCDTPELITNILQVAFMMKNISIYLNAMMRATNSTICDNNSNESNTTTKNQSQD